MLIEIIGWTGGLLVLGAYFLISLRYLQTNSIYYQLMNIVGALLLIINTIYLKAYPSAFVNVVWVGIGVAGLYKSIMSPKN